MASAKNERARARRSAGKTPRAAREVRPARASAARHEAAQADRRSEPELRELDDEGLREMRDTPRAAGDPLADFGTPDGAGTAAARSAGSSAELAGGDLDAAVSEVGSGEEAVGGSTPTPDQDNVDELGRAVGLTYQDEEPLRGAEEKMERRDDERWELNPASDEDFGERRGLRHALPEKGGKGRGRG